MGIKSMKGVGEIYPETKKVISVGVTPIAIEGLNAIAKSMGISRSELIEQIGRGLLKVGK
jgi:Ribbon-helix-helix protein, copG family